VIALGLIGTLASVLGNEAAIRFGRRRLVGGAMLLSIALALVLVSVGAASYGLAVVLLLLLLLLLHGLVVWLDSSSLTGGHCRAGAPGTTPCRAFDTGLCGRFRGAARSP